MKNLKKIHIVLDSIYIDYWIYKSLQIIINEHPQLRITHNIIEKKTYSFKLFLFSIFKTVSSIIYSSSHKKSLSKKNLYTIINPKTKTLEIDSDAIILNFSNRIIKNESDNCLLEFRYGKNYYVNKKFFGWNEFGEGSNLLESYLIENRLKNKKVIFKTFSSFHQFAIKRSIDFHLFKQVNALVRFFKKELPTNQNILLNDKYVKNYSSREIFIKLIGAVLNKYVINKNKNKNKRKGKWSIAISNNYFDRDINNFKIINPPSDLFWADPFILKDEKGINIFIEEKKIKSKNGYISLLIEDGNSYSTKKIIEEKYHLSYPYVFKFDSQYYMLTESIQNKTINLYKSSNYPLKWEFEKYIFSNIMAVDPTIIKYNDVWWLFINKINNPYESIQDELYIYYSENPISSDWSSHKLNPVVSDVRTSRPAGRIINYNGKLIRPSQNSLKRYGYSLNLMEIIKLSKYEYEEKLIEKIEPWNSDIKALHTFNTVEGKTIIDLIT